MSTPKQGVINGQAALNAYLPTESQYDEKITDLIADLLHLAISLGQDPDGVAESALLHCWEEQEAQNEEEVLNLIGNDVIGRTEEVSATLNGLTVTVVYKGRGDMHGPAYQVLVFGDDGDPPMFDEVDIFMPYRGDEEALCVALSFLVGYAADGHRPSLEPHLATLKALSEKYPT